MFMQFIFFQREKDNDNNAKNEFKLTRFKLKYCHLEWKYADDLTRIT